MARILYVSGISLSYRYVIPEAEYTTVGLN
jgi:hypothetical protein